MIALVGFAIGFCSGVVFCLIALAILNAPTSNPAEQKRGSAQR